MTCMRARKNSNFGLIGPPTAELAALVRQTWGELIVNANALIMHSFFPVIQGND